MQRVLDHRLYSKHFYKILTLIYFFGALLLLASAFTGEGGDIVVGDARHYFEYIRSLFYDGSFPDRYIKYPCGVSFIGSIGYALFMPVNFIFQKIGGGSLLSTPPGFTIILHLGYCSTFIFLSYVAILLNLKTLEQLGYSSDFAKPALLFWITGTNIIYYFFKEPSMSETSTYFSVSLFYFVLLRYFYKAQEKELVRHAIYVGLSLGLASMIKQINILHCVGVPILLWKALSSSCTQGIKKKVRTFVVVNGVVAFFAGLLFAVPYFCWYCTAQNVSLYSYGGETFHFLDPKLITVLFSPNYHGLFAWAPISFFSCVGLCFFLKRHSDLTWVVILPIFGTYYLVASWEQYWMGASFGHRGFLQYTLCFFLVWLHCSNIF